MNSKSISRAVRIAAVVVLGLGTSALAQAPTPVHFRGIINDYTSAHDTKGNLTRPWEMHGTWSLELNNRFSKADFSAALTMEHSDFAISQDIVDADDPATRSAHTHHITMKNATISDNTADCPGEPAGNPPTTPRFVVTGYADITGNGSPAPFSKGGTIIPAAGLHHRRNGCPIFEHHPAARRSCHWAFRRTADPGRGARAEEVRSGRSSRRPLGGTTDRAALRRVRLHLARMRCLLCRTDG